MVVKRLSQSLVLFSLGRIDEIFCSRYTDKPLAIVFSKTDFIDFIYNLKVTDKDKDKLGYVLYKILQKLEEKKMVKYNNKRLQLTSKGRKEYERGKKRVSPYCEVLFLTEKTSFLKSQTIFRL